MGTTKESYSFGTNDQVTPKYIVAPMVEQSELAWRMLSRKHGAHLCFTPMYSANTLVLDSTYRSKILSDLSCKEDRPIFVQFCSNNVNNFVEAGLAVQDLCDGIDLNLGCPQHIARRGCYGAYLQENWELIHEIISTAKTKLKIPVSAKIRVFPEIDKTIEYCKMLEKAGCCFITVHGRTREQRGKLSGKASWDHIKAVKENLKVPIFANGNIAFKSNIDECLRITNADGVMTAEGHLSNPYIFEDQNPPVYEVFEEYISFVREYPCPLSQVRTHMFRLWANTLKVYKFVRIEIGRAISIEELLACNSTLRELCLKEENKSKLPHWFCQPYYRDATEKNEPSEKVENEIGRDGDATISKNQQKRIARYEKKVEHMKSKRREEHERRKARDKIRILNDISEERYVRRIEQKKATLDRLDMVMKYDKDSLKVCVDLSWSGAMNKKEISKLAGQLSRLYGSNRSTQKPAHIYFSGFKREDFLWQECIRKHDGFESYKIDMTPSSYDDLFTRNEIVYLSPDSPNPLQDVSTDVVYILGGLVDETVCKKLTLDGAANTWTKTARLPINEYMCRSQCHKNYSTVYSINQVFDMLLTQLNTGSWKEAFKVGVPLRKGYILKPDDS